MHVFSAPSLARLLAPALLLLLAACATSAGPKTRADAAAPELTLVTLNLWHDKGDWPKREKLIVARLRELRPDVIALQEVLQRDGLPNQARTLAEALGYEYVFASVDADSRPQRFGNAILSRHPILAHDWKALLPLDDFRSIVRVRVAVDGRQVNVYDTHLHWTEQGGAIRATQVRDALAYIARTAGDAPSVLAGDLNASMDAPELQPLLGDFLDAYAAMHPGMAPGDRAHATLDLAQYPPRHIDQVLLQREAFVPLQARVILDDPDAEGTLASDHYGVLVKFRFAEPAKHGTGISARATSHDSNPGRPK
ncbi:endonuclease/exonuclease/phosphatase family protein [Luteimonas notoginsengisoli]|uniref:Endonuclease/exonuclease/phosphatase family protein n=1 Tax=Luteimonas notoginsengisoli TaxID=1578200 RepID=A0ABV7UQZ7_9GAMM